MVANIVPELIINFFNRLKSIFKQILTTFFASSRAEKDQSTKARKPQTCEDKSVLVPYSPSPSTRISLMYESHHVARQELGSAAQRSGKNNITAPHTEPATQPKFFTPLAGVIKDKPNPWKGYSSSILGYMGFKR